MKIIAVEGVDGAGKSTVCKFLKTKLDPPEIIIAKTPTELFYDLTGHARDHIAKFYSYLLADIGVCNIYKDCRFLILDRYILSSLVYHHSVVSALKTSLPLIFENVGLIKPVATILLDSEDSIIKERLENRNGVTNHSYQTNDLRDLYNYYISNENYNPWVGKIVRATSDSSDDLVFIEKEIEKIVSLST